MIEAKVQTIRKLSHKGSRKKGSRGEYAVRDELKKLGIDARRVPMSGALAWMKGDVREFNTDPSHVHEVKNCEALAIPAWWRQASVQLHTDNEIPVLDFTSNHKEMHTVMRAKDFDDMVYAYEQKRPEIAINLITLPLRKNFWKFHDANKTGLHDVYIFDLAGKKIADVTYPDETLVVISFKMYIFLRKYEINSPK